MEQPSQDVREDADIGVARRLVALDDAVESNTRGFTRFRPKETNTAFADRGFNVREERPQFLLPTVRHRLTDQAGLSKVADTPGRLLGLTRWPGHP